MSGNYYSIDIWGLLIALVMVAVAAGISEAMRMGIGKTLLWSACRALLQLCAMGFIMEFVIKSNNPWLVLLLVTTALLFPIPPSWHPQVRSVTTSTTFPHSCLTQSW